MRPSNRRGRRMSGARWNVVLELDYRSTTGFTGKPGAGESKKPIRIPPPPHFVRSNAQNKSRACSQSGPKRRAQASAPPLERRGM
eukprot:1866931-Prymnesium_polylepis.1